MCLEFIGDTARMSEAGERGVSAERWIRRIDTKMPPDKARASHARHRKVYGGYLPIIRSNRDSF